MSQNEIFRYCCSKSRSKIELVFNQNTKLNWKSKKRLWSSFFKLFAKIWQKICCTIIIWNVPCSHLIYWYYHGYFTTVRKIILFLTLLKKLCHINIFFAISVFLREYCSTQKIHNCFFAWKFWRSARFLFLCFSKRQKLLPTRFQWFFWDGSTFSANWYSRLA